jgi:small ligand-binding sensory domain FIST
VACTAAALSEHPLLTHAVGECVGHLLERGGPSPDLVVLGVTEPVVGALEDVHAAVRRLLDPGVLIGAASEGLLGGAQLLERRAAVSMFAMWFAPSPASDGVTAPRPVRLSTLPDADGPAWSALDELTGASGTLVVCADPDGPSPAELEQHLTAVAPELSVVGGSVELPRGSGSTRLLLDGAVHRDGAVGVLLPADLPVQVVVSQGFRPFGPALTVTSCERNVVRELGGRPALDRLMEAVELLGPEDRALAANAVHLGHVVDESRDEPGPGDFLVHSVLGADRSIGALAVAAPVELGAIVRFHLFDADGATHELASLAPTVGPTGGVLAFLGARRGARLFDVVDRDALTLADRLGPAPLAGLTCAAELGPVGGRGFVHHRSVALVAIG